jgi:hypothetical protein
MGRRRGTRQINLVRDIGERGSSLPMDAVPRVHRDAAQRSEAGEDTLGAQTTPKQDLGSEMTLKCVELIDTSAADASSLSMTQKKGSDTLLRSRSFRWTDGHLRLTNDKRSQATERQTQSAMRILVHPFRSGSSSIYCNHDASICTICVKRTSVGIAQSTAQSLPFKCLFPLDQSQVTLSYGGLSSACRQPASALFAEQLVHRAGVNQHHLFNTQERKQTVIGHY